MQTTAAALTMVRDDPFFLKAWVRHYGETLGRENCYVVNHGRGKDIHRLAEGCNVIGIPGDPHPKFDMKRWRMLNNFVQGLRCYYDHVIVGDVDELVALDPAQGMSLLEFLARQPKRRVLTPVGLEVLHRVDIEPDPIRTAILGPRRHVRLAPHYSKPCILSKGVKIARGGHFTEESELVTPEGLLLFHLKFCDFATYSATMDRRNDVTRSVGGDVKTAAIGWHWFPEARGCDQGVFAAFAEREVVPFDLAEARQRMHATWQKRRKTDFWEFDRAENAEIMVLPERFAGLL